MSDPFDTSIATLSAPRHGADLAQASKRYGIPLSDWLDLSTGINPLSYPVGDIDAAAFQHLPFDDAALCAAARDYCGATQMPVAAAGSQVLIQWLPLVKQRLAQRACRVAVPAIGYSEHAFRWQWAGHQLIAYDPRDANAIDRLLQTEAIDALVVINAHNPLGVLLSPVQLLAWHAQLAQRKGWLIVDEAFVDPTPEASVAAYTDRVGLIVLRSLGKFFGLAGVRCGFAFCDDVLSHHLRVAVGPWSVSGPALSIATTALRDTAWQQSMRAQLTNISTANADVLRDVFELQKPGRCHALFTNKLFNSVCLNAKTANALEESLAQQGVRVRRIDIDAAAGLLRFGLVDPQNAAAWSRFIAAMRLA